MYWYIFKIAQVVLYLYSKPFLKCKTISKALNEEALTLGWNVYNLNPARILRRNEFNGSVRIAP